MKELLNEGERGPEITVSDVVVIVDGFRDVVPVKKPTLSV
jgi:hypothetical protein